MKRKRASNDDRSTSLKSKSIEHYFKNATVTTKTSSSTLVIDRYERDLEHAIQQSLIESVESSSTDTLNTQNTDSGETNPFIHVEALASGSRSFLKPQQQQQYVSNSLKQCPICDVLLEETVDANSHINRCLDDFERSDTPTESNTNMISETTNRMESQVELSIMALQELNNNMPTPDVLDRNLKANGKGKGRGGNQSPNNKPKRKCPFYKWIQGTPFVVDAFSYGKIENCHGYFLSHYHSDHYHGLSSSWSHGPIYCSKITSNFLTQELRVDSKYIIALPMDQDYVLNNSINVSLIEANHCPGSVLFLFKVYRPDGTIARHLHTGDFRANPRMCLHPLIRQPENGILDSIYLDTTYLNGQYSFPAQEEVIAATCNLVEQCVSGAPIESKPGWLHGWLNKPSGETSTSNDNTGNSINHSKNKCKPGVLIIVGTYSIGKERLFYNLAKRLNCKVYATPTKKRFITAQENKDLESILVDDPRKAQIHLCPMGHIQEERLSQYMKTFHPHFTSVVALRPTGWTFKKSSTGIMALSDMSLAQVTSPPKNRTVVLKPQRSSSDTVKIYGVPYSEHSSFRELASFVGSLEVRRIIPTVNVGSEESRQKMNAILQRWESEKKKNGIQLVPYPTEDHW